jgi:iron(III) transport system ATP-binding protein
LSVYENVAYGLRVQRRKNAEVRERVAGALDQVELRGMENRSPSQLSGGQQQRVALARALVVQPAVLLFDEPLSNLDATLREQMRFQIRALQKKNNITAVYVTHDQAEAMVLSDRVVVMSQGTIRQVGPPHEVYGRPSERFVAGFLGRANFIPARVVEAGGGDGATTLDVAGTRFPARGPASTRAGDDVTVVLRPEAVTVVEANGQASELALRGTVRHSAFLGPVVEYEVALPDGAAVAVHDRNPDRLVPLPEGTAVEIRPLQRELYYLVSDPDGERAGTEPRTA